MAIKRHSQAAVQFQEAVDSSLKCVDGWDVAHPQ